MTLYLLLNISFRMSSQLFNLFNPLSQVNYLTYLTLYPSEPSAPPNNVHAKVFENNTMLVSWQPPASKHLNGPLLGYKVSVADVSRRSRF